MSKAEEDINLVSTEEENKTTADEAPAIGIDLGTTYSCVALFQHGKVETIINSQGNTAKDQANTNPKNTIFDAKRMIGRKFDDTVVQADMQHWPFTVRNVNSKLQIEVEYKKVKKLYFPEEISAAILMKLKESAEAYLGKTVNKAVITVPANFNNDQREATKLAAKIAGLDVLCIINEPTAAAIECGLYKQHEDNKRIILVYNLGGGTFDVSIMSMNKGTFMVMSTVGNTHLGGQDFDNLLVKDCVEAFERENNTKLDNKVALNRLRTACERAKKILSEAIQTRITLDYFVDGKTFDRNITSEAFEFVNDALFRSTIEPIDDAIREAKITKSDIDDIVLVGGSTRIPMIRKLLTEHFDGKKLNTSINPDEAVAHGAAILAAILEKDSSVEIEKFMLIPITHLTLGIEVEGGRMTPIIWRNTVIPVNGKKIVSNAEDGQTEVNIKIFEGERAMSADNHLLGSFTLSGISPVPRGTAQIEVIVDIDINGILNVTASDIFGKGQESLEIKKHNSLSQEKIESMIQEAEEFRAEDEKRKRAVPSKVALERYCRTMQRTTANLRLANSNAIQRKFNETMVWLNRNQFAEKEEYDERLQNVKSFFDEIYLS